MLTAYVEQVLCPLRRPRQIVVLDNLSSRRRVAARAAIVHAAYRLLWLPAYSPDCNPLDKLAFAKV